MAIEDAAQEGDLVFSNYSHTATAVIIFCRTPGEAQLIKY